MDEGKDQIQRNVLSSDFSQQDYGGIKQAHTLNPQPPPNTELHQDRQLQCLKSQLIFGFSQEQFQEQSPESSTEHSTQLSIQKQPVGCLPNPGFKPQTIQGFLRNHVSVILED